MNIEDTKPHRMLTISELKKRWELSYNTVYPIARNFKKNIKQDKKLYVSLDEVEYYEKHELSRKKPKLIGEYINSSQVKDWLKENGFTNAKGVLGRLIRNNLLGKPILKRNVYLIPKSDFIKFIDNYEPYRILTSKNEPSILMGFKPKGTLCVRELFLRWNLGSYKSVYKYFEKNKLPQPISFLGTKFIKITDIEKYETKNQPLTTNKLIQRLTSQILNYKSDCKIQVTDFYIDFCLLKLKSSSASIKVKRDRVTKYITTYKRFISKFLFDPLTLADSEIELIMRRIDIPNDKKETISSFFRYCDSLLDIKRTKQVVYKRESNNKTNSDNNSIYSPEHYFEYVNYVKNIDFLIPLSISSQRVSNAWLFIIMHLTDVWRAADIVNNLPSINLEELGIESFDWFSQNQLSISKATSVIQEVSRKVEQSISSKTKALLNFLIIPDMVIPFAISAIISELHRREHNQELLLSTLTSSNSISDYTKQLMFIDNKQLMDFQSRKMNRSTLTYLFYSITDENGTDMDMALELAKVTRTHKSVSTTEIYLNTTSKDGSINKVSLNVFRRGHFGWLYNYIIDMTIDPLVSQISGEKKTILIEQIRSEFKPFEIEGWGEFINSKVNQLESVITVLSRYSTTDFIILIKKLMSGNLPARTENGNCLIYPECEYPTKKTCFSCIYFIPTSSILTEASLEFKKLSQSIKVTRYDALIQRDSRFLLYIILLFHEAYLTFNEEYVNSFLPKAEFETILKEILPILKLQGDLTP